MGLDRSQLSLQEWRTQWYLDVMYKTLRDMIQGAHHAALFLLELNNRQILRVFVPTTSLELLSPGSQGN